jgi:alpha-beta hydrolase superfamily lysophospholipase
MQRITNGIYKGTDGRESLYDLFLPEDWHGDLILFVHGFMGFKDWGAWNLVATYFAQQGFAFAKLNLSHNGGTVENPLDFPDLEAFSKNTYSKEVEDLSLFRKHLATKIHAKRLYLIGHSRGGAAVILNARNEYVDKIVLWASICDIGRRFPEGPALENWKNQGYRTVLNGRTGQELPQQYSLYEDYLKNATQLNLEAAIKSMRTPTLVIHGDQDRSVELAEGEALAAWSQTKLAVIPGADHVFGAHHPWTKNELPQDLLEVCEKTKKFLQEK